MKPSRGEIADRLLWLSGAMGRVADAMRLAELGDECDGHARELAGAASLAAQWSREIARNDGEDLGDA